MHWLYCSVLRNDGVVYYYVALSLLNFHNKVGRKYDIAFAGIAMVGYACSHAQSIFLHGKSHYCYYYDRNTLSYFFYRSTVNAFPLLVFHKIRM